MLEPLMTAPLSAEELQRLIDDDNTPDEVLAQYLRPAPDRRLPQVPMLAVDTSRIRGPADRGIFGIDLKSLNDRTNRRRLAAYNKRIVGGWSGLRLLAEGDSWFLYPVLLRDVLDNLSRDYAIFSVAAAGDTLENMARGTSHLAQLIEEHKFHGLLLSAGGNDIAGDALASYIKQPPVAERQPGAYIGPAFETFTTTTYERLRQLAGGLLDRFPDLRVFVHGYDWPFPQKGPWLEPAMAARQVPPEDRPAIIKWMINRHYETLAKLAQALGPRLIVVDCRGTVGPIAEWFDELHPRDRGFARAAAKFRERIDETFALTHQRSAAQPRYRIAWQPLGEKSGARRQTRELPPGAEITIGRSADREILLDDQRVSRNHAHITVDGDGATVDDPGSANGVFIDGRRIKREAWRPGQLLRITPYTFTIEAVHHVTVAPVAPALSAAMAGRKSGGEAAAAAGAATDARSNPSGSLEVEVCVGDIAAAKCEAYVLGLFHHVSPIASRGAAMAIDDAVGGQISALVQGGRASSHVGAVELVDAPANARLSGTIALAGLGDFGEFGPKVLEKVGEEVAASLAAKGIAEAVTVPVGGSVGVDVAELLQLFLAGFARGLKRSGASSPFRRLRICELSRERAEAIAAALDSGKAASVLGTEGLTLKVGPLVELPPISRAVDTRKKPQLSPPCWIWVHSRSPDTFAYRILTPQPRAGIPRFEQVLAKEAGQRLSAAIANPRLLDAASGCDIAGLLLPEAARAMITEATTQPDTPLVVVHDEASSAIPWEALYFGQHCPALVSGVSRIFEVIAQPGEETLLRRKSGEALRMLLIENPTQDLAATTIEGQALMELFAASMGEVKVMVGLQASRQNVLVELAKGIYDIVHFAGHAGFVEGEAQASGVLLSDGTLAAVDLDALDKVPQFIFLNACESGRVRSAAGAAEDISTRSMPKAVLSSPSLAAGLIASGVKTFIGTRWPVNDSTAAEFAKVLYGGLLVGEPMGLAISKARQKIVPMHPRDWANYIHFGDPTYTLRQV